MVEKRLYGILTGSAMVALATNSLGLVKELIEMAKTKSEGWIEYMYPKPEN